MDNTGNHKRGVKYCNHEYEFYSTDYRTDVYKCIYCNKSLVVKEERKDENEYTR